MQAPDYDLLNRMLTILEGTVRDLSARTETLEKMQQRDAIVDARREEREKASDARLQGIEDSVNRLNNNVTWVVRLIVGAVITALLAVAFKGLSVPGA